MHGIGEIHSVFGGRPPPPLTDYHKLPRIQGLEWLRFHPIITILACNEANGGAARNWKFQAAIHRFSEPPLVTARKGPELQDMTSQGEYFAAGSVESRSRPEKSYEAARRHSRRVVALKIGVPVGALLLVGMFAGWAWLSSPGGLSVDLTGSAVKDGKLVMANPRLNGFTKDNLPYEMMAERAIQDLTITSKIALEKIDARLPIEAEKWADISADNGVFDNEANTLDVTSPMTITTTDGMRAELRSAFVDMSTGRIISSEPVRISMNGSLLNANTLTVEDRGKIIIFEDNVRMTILPDQLKTGEADG